MKESRSVVSNIAGTFIIQIPNYILGLVAGIFLTRQLGPEGKGVHTLLTTNVQLMVMFLGLNLPGAIQFFVASKKLEAKQMTGLAMFLLLTGSLIVFILLFLIPHWGNVLLETNYDTYFFRVYLFISFFISNFNLIITGFLQGHHRFREVNRVSFLNSILNFVIFVSLYFAVSNNYIEAGLPEVLILTVVILALNTLFLVFFLRKYVKMQWSLSLSNLELRPLLNFMLPAYFSVLINFFNYRLTIWMVNYFEGNEQLGYFSLALNFAQMMLMVTMAINTVLFPYFAAKSETDDIVKDFNFAFKINLIIMFFATIGLIICSPFLIPAFYSDVFIPAIIPVQILAIGTFFCSQSQVFGHFFGARNKNWLNSIIYSLALVFLVVFGFILTPEYGIEGAAYASVASYLVMFILFLIAFKSYYKASVLSLFIVNKSDYYRFKSILQNKLRKS